MSKFNSDAREYAKRYYEAHKRHIREYQKKYHEEHKDEIRVKYAHHREAWDKAHRAYLNEHARLAKEIRIFPSFSRTLKIKKDYLRELHAKGMI